MIPYALPLLVGTPKDSDLDAKEFLATTPQLLPGDVDLSAYTTETNQLSLSSCASNATADSIEVLNDVAEKAAAAREGRAPMAPIQVSRMFIYNITREKFGRLHINEGTYIRDNFQTLTNFGVCSEELWPYALEKFNVSPSMMAMRTAVANRIRGFYCIKDEGEDRLAQILAALRAKHPVVFGTGITSDFQSYNGNGTIQKPGKDEEISNHAMLIIGFYSGKGFLVKNSWGRNWGLSGLCFMSEDYLMWDKSFDFWVPTQGADLST